GATKQLEIAKASADAEDAINANLLARKEIDDVEYATRKQAIESQYLKLQQNAEITELAKGQALNDKALADKSITLKGYYAASEELRTEFELTQDKNDKLAIARDAKNKRTL